MSRPSLQNNDQRVPAVVLEVTTPASYLKVKIAFLPGDVPTGVSTPTEPAESTGDSHLMVQQVSS